MSPDSGMSLSDVPKTVSVGYPSQICRCDLRFFLLLGDIFRRRNRLHLQTAIVAASADWLSTSRVPKLFFRAELGAILANDKDLAFIRRLPALTEVTVAGRHYVQEDSPDEIGRAIAGWTGALG
jgi:hypothetical protein